MFVPAPISEKRVDRALALAATGLSDYDVARKTGVCRSSVRRWRTHGRPRAVPPPPRNWRPANPASYVCLLGIYLGDGYLLNPQARSPVLEVSLDPRYPGIIDECVASIGRVADTTARVTQRKTPKGEAIRLVATSPMWPQAFPQHGRGRKHERPIHLKPWQRALVDRFPQQLLRGLIHADGARVVNRFTMHLAYGPREYRYVRYFFTNLSADIRGIFCDACDRLGVHWTQSNAKNISISSRSSVAILDSFIGSKR